ncbi:MAG TPA: nicotinate-nucleotide adenylyltransferase [Gemmatimonadales bacterium]|nr:nicotinate-nucleotide adenylyltransferase [Gemmatimonadales bacterium]
MVGIFGGSFDPIHHGHLIVARVAAETLGLAEVRFVPAREQPFKVGRHSAGAAHRAAMAERAIAGTAGFTLETIELERTGASYTVDTLRALRDRDPEIELVLLIGSDAAADFPKWREAAEVTRLARVVVFGRPGTPHVTLPGAWRTIEVPAIGISATEIRRRVREGLPIRYWVPDAVADYVAAHGLYQDGEG